MRKSSLPILALFLAPPLASNVRADGMFFQYEGDVIPTEADGWIIDPCTHPCTPSIENGHLVFHWSQGGDWLQYGRRFIGEPPTSFWVEWRFRSNQLKPPNFYTCDGWVGLSFRNISETIYMFADAAVSASSNDFVLGLASAEFHSLRFESADGTIYRVSVDGLVFIDGIDTTGINNTIVGMNSEGGCPNSMQERINEWDFLRVGTLSSGELIVATDPPSGFLDPLQYGALDRFTITYDTPSYAYIDEISVEVTGGSAPQVMQTRRLDNGAPEVLEIVLDRPLPIGHTTRFTFDDGTVTNLVDYTIGVPGACCNQQGTCADSVDPICTDSGNLFVPDQTCSDPVPCCIPLGLCQMLDPVCCMALSRIVAASTACGGDSDADGVDALCGDECPSDMTKLAPGQCGCGVSDSADSDSDTVLDCFDECPGVNDHLFAPGCVAAIPVASQWGLFAIALALMCASKIVFGSKPAIEQPTSISSQNSKTALPEMPVGMKSD